MTQAPTEETPHSCRRCDLWKHATQAVTGLATYHPSAILRAEGARAQELRTMLVQDLRRAARLAKAESP